MLYGLPRGKRYQTRYLEYPVDYGAQETIDAVDAEIKQYTANGWMVYEATEHPKRIYLHQKTTRLYTLVREVPQAMTESEAGE